RAVATTHALAVSGGAALGGSQALQPARGSRRTSAGRQRRLYGGEGDPAPEPGVRFARTRRQPRRRSAELPGQPDSVGGTSGGLMVRKRQRPGEDPGRCFVCSPAV